MKVSAAGMAMIQSFEGLRLRAYKDIVGVVTIGYGHTGKDVKMGMTITKAQAEDMMRMDLAWFEQAVGGLLQLKATQNQFDAMVSLAYNIGGNAFADSTLLRKFNKGDSPGAADEFLRWTRAGGKNVQGLVRRRQQERNHFLGAAA